MSSAWKYPQICIQPIVYPAVRPFFRAVTKPRNPTKTTTSRSSPGPRVTTQRLAQARFQSCHSAPKPGHEVRETELDLSCPFSCSPCRTLADIAQRLFFSPHPLGHSPDLSSPYTDEVQVVQSCEAFLSFWFSNAAVFFPLRLQVFSRHFPRYQVELEVFSQHVPQYQVELEVFFQLTEACRALCLIEKLAGAR